MSTVTTTSRETAAFVIRSNGAWLIAMSGPATDDATPGDMYGCAASLRTAKRVARETAEAFDYSGPWRWHLEDSGTWTLEATWTDQYEDYQ